MKARLIIWLILCSIFPGIAQELKVEWMKQRPLTDMSAATNSRKDRNGQDCAVVKVLFPKQGLKFEGNVIGDTPFKDGEYWVYMSEDSKYLRVKHSDFTPLMITFEKEGINQIISKGVYELKLTGNSLELYPVKFRVYPEDALLMVDQIERDLTAGVIELQLTPGDHTYTVMKPGYQGQSNKFEVHESNSNKIIIELDKKSGKTEQPEINPIPFTTPAPPANPSSTPVLTQTPEAVPPKDEQSIVEEMKKAYGAQDYEKTYELALSIPDNPDAQFRLGYLYHKGLGIKQDYSKAIEWYLKAADNGDAKAMINIGGLYESGKGIPQDYSKAMEWYLKAEEKGEAFAIYNIGIMYLRGHGVPQDYSKAMECFLNASEKGDAAAMNNLGAMYTNGEGVPQDYSKALEWYQKAADKGDATAMFNIGVLYYKGEGVPKNVEEAKKWYQKAADIGYRSAKKQLEILNKE